MGKRVNQEIKNYLNGILHMNVVDHLGTYLRLPSSFTLEKVKIFSIYYRGEKVNCFQEEEKRF